MSDTSWDVYISSSWKNRDRVRAVAVALRAQGLKVYDFTDASCRNVPEIPPEKFPAQFDPSIHEYAKYITSVPEWRAAIECNQKAIAEAKVTILLLPCGMDAHADWAYAVGQGKRTAVVGVPKAGDRIPTHMWTDKFLKTDEEAVAWCVETCKLSPYDRDKPLSAEEAEGMLARLKRHFHAPVMPIDRYCKALRTWQEAMSSRAYRAATELFPDLALQDYKDPRAKAAADECNAARNVKDFCDKAIAEGRKPSERDYALDRWRDYERTMESIRYVFLQIAKSNLLSRLLYGGEPLREKMCEKHKGHWSGCVWVRTKDDPDYCECLSGSNVTGWIAPEKTPSP